MVSPSTILPVLLLCVVVANVQQGNAEKPNDAPKHAKKETKGADHEQQTEGTPKHETHTSHSPTVASSHQGSDHKSHATGTPNHEGSVHPPHATNAPSHNGSDHKSQPTKASGHGGPDHQSHATGAPSYDGSEHTKRPNNASLPRMSDDEEDENDAEELEDASIHQPDSNDTAGHQPVSSGMAEQGRPIPQRPHFRRYIDRIKMIPIIEVWRGEKWDRIQPPLKPGENNEHISNITRFLTLANGTKIECRSKFDYSYDNVHWYRPTRFRIPVPHPLHGYVFKYKFGPKRWISPWRSKIFSNITYTQFGSLRASYDFGHNDSWFRPPANFSGNPDKFKLDIDAPLKIQTQHKEIYRYGPVTAKADQAVNVTRRPQFSRGYPRQRYDYRALPYSDRTWSRPYTEGRWGRPYDGRFSFNDPYYSERRYNQRYDDAYADRRYSPNRYDDRRFNYDDRRYDQRYSDPNDQRYGDGYSERRYDQKYSEPFDGRRYDQGRGSAYDERRYDHGRGSAYDERRYDQDRGSTYDERRYDQGYRDTYYNVGRYDGGTYDGKRYDQGYRDTYDERRGDYQRNDAYEGRRSDQPPYRQPYSLNNGSVRSDRPYHDNVQRRKWDYKSYAEPGRPVRTYQDYQYRWDNSRRPHGESYEEYKWRFAYLDDRKIPQDKQKQDKYFAQEYYDIMAKASKNIWKLHRDIHTVLQDYEILKQDGLDPKVIPQITNGSMVLLSNLATRINAEMEGNITLTEIKQPIDRATYARKMNNFDKMLEVLRGYKAATERNPKVEALSKKIVGLKQHLYLSYGDITHMILVLRRTMKKHGYVFKF